MFVLVRDRQSDTQLLVGHRQSDTQLLVGQAVEQVW